MDQASETSSSVEFGLAVFPATARQNSSTMTATLVAEAVAAAGRQRLLGYAKCSLYFVFRVKAYCLPVVRPAVVRPLTPISHVVISVYGVDGFQ